MLYIRQIPEKFVGNRIYIIRVSAIYFKYTFDTRNTTYYRIL